MARKPAPTTVDDYLAQIGPARSPAPPRSAGTAAGPAQQGQSAAVEQSLRQDDCLLAAAALIPMLEAAAEAGHTPSRLAAGLLRRLAGRTPPLPQALGEDQLAAAVHRLTTLAREQDRQIVRLQTMLESLL